MYVVKTPCEKQAILLLGVIKHDSSNNVKSEWFLICVTSNPLDVTDKCQENNSMCMSTSLQKRKEKSCIKEKDVVVWIVSDISIDFLKHFQTQM